MDRSAISEQLKYIVRLLVDGEYERLFLENRYTSEHLSISDGFREAISTYPGRMTMPPDIIFDGELDIVEKIDGNLDVEVHLWFSDEQSQLRLIAVAEKHFGGFFVKAMDILS